MKKFREDRVFHGFAVVVLAVFAVISVIPFILLLMSSVSSEKSLLTYGYNFIPKEISFAAYEYLLVQAGQIAKAYMTTIVITAIGTSLGLIMTILAAYPLSRTDFGHRNVILFFFFFTTLFSGGLVPSYMMWTQIFHIKNTYMAYILPGMLCGAMNIILVKNFFKFNVPDALIEAAKIDGASELRVLRQIVLPISKPILAVIGINTGLAFWNDWMSGLYYIDKPDMYNIQVLLNRILNDMQYLSQMYSKGSNLGQMASAAAALPTTAARMAIAVIVVLPILILFPFFQKYFVKGIVVGAVKG